MLNTETPATRHIELDLYPTEKLVDALIDDQFDALQAVRKVSAEIAAAVATALPRIAAGGRLVYVGAGTSGRLGVLDSVELTPTFSWPKEKTLALLAGGQSAMFVAVEGAEDNAAQGAADIHALALQPNDVVLLLAASGATPYVIGALQSARECGALTIGWANNPNAPVTAAADIGITLDTGSEIISGSTRLKAGTSQKIALNTFSSALMVRLNKVYKNLMVDVKASNEKLLRRTVHLTMFATGKDEETCRQVLQQCDYHVKTAIVAILDSCSVDQAQEKLKAGNGNIRAALKAQ